MTRVTIEPGPCGFITSVEAEENDDGEAVVKVRSGCKSIMGMMEELGDTFDPMDICLKKPGQGDFYEYAQGHFPVHAACPVINGILKCIEAECGLALKKDVAIRFEE